MSARPLIIFLSALAIGALATLAATAGAGAADEQRYTVVLDNAFGLTEGSDLRAAGVTIGKIDELDVQRSTARALARIVVTQPSFAGFREDVRCEVKPQSLIGEYYLDCDPGSKESPAPRTIPVEQTGGTVPPDLVLDILRRPARERFGLILTELGIGFTARGEDVQTTLRRAVPALRETDRVLSILDANRRTINQLTRDADTVLAGLAGNRRDVGRFIDEAADTTAGERQPLRRALARPSTSCRASCASCARRSPTSAPRRACRRRPCATCASPPPTSPSCCSASARSRSPRGPPCAVSARRR